MNIFRTIPAVLLLLLYIPTSAAVSPPEKVIIDTSERMLEIIHKEGDALRENRERVYKVIDEVINPHIDFNRMSRWVLGKHWRKATDEQKTRFTKEFRFLLMRTYATAITEYSGEKIEYLPARFKPDDTDITVRTELRQPGNPNP
ncbi:MAG: ABC transporter substrate-binding protein, partial [Gammaproteobacteria bacterium]|nr:ABC transporter substrate-binding protein [Gammaproteobacteria bacterium]